jgi:hypothetical protein
MEFISDKRDESKYFSNYPINKKGRPERAPKKQCSGLLGRKTVYQDFPYPLALYAIAVP